MPKFTIRRADPEVDEDDAVTIMQMFDAVFNGYVNGKAPRPDLSQGSWWIARTGRDESAGFAGMAAPEFQGGPGYLCLSAVLPAHRGHGLQRRLIQVRERAARAMGYPALVTDTHCNPASANNLIALGYTMYHPKDAWALKNSIYWWKDLS